MCYNFFIKKCYNKEKILIIINRRDFMQFVGNLLWFLIFGLILAASYVVIGLVLCLTIVFIPFGKQFFKLAAFVIWPFGSVIELDVGAHPVANVIWMIFGGLEEAIALFLIGLVFHITIIGIPFGKQFFKLAKLSLAPFGATVI